MSAERVKWKLLDHSVITTMIAQWRSRLSASVVLVDILNINFEPMTFWCVLFILSIPVSVNLIDKTCAKC